MPYVHDFSTLRDVKEVRISPKGWTSPIVVEYGVGERYGPTYFWRVKGTKHTFVIPMLRLNYISQGDYAAHFKDVLEKFLENDYNEWKRKGFPIEWMREYRDEFEKFVL